MTQRPSSPTPPSAEPTHTSRRGALRASGLNIAVTFVPEGQHMTLRGVIIDLSATGAQLLAPKTLAKGQLIQVDFVVPKGPRIKASATVKHCKPTSEGRHALGIALAVTVEEELALAQWVFDHV